MHGAMELEAGIIYDPIVQAQRTHPLHEVIDHLDTYLSGPPRSKFTMIGIEAEADIKVHGYCTPRPVCCWKPCCKLRVGVFTVLTTSSWCSLKMILKKFGSKSLQKNLCKKPIVKILCYIETCTKLSLTANLVFP